MVTAVKRQRMTSPYPSKPDPLKVSLPAKGGLHVTTGDEPPGSLHGPKAERTSVARVVRDLIRGFHRTHFGYQQEGKESCESPVSRKAQLTPPGVSGPGLSRQQ
jgi:hypothetical protein